MGVGDAEFGEAPEEGELREDKEVDVGDDDEDDAAPAGDKYGDSGFARMTCFC